MTSFLSWLMSPQDYMPHGMCFLWQPELIALHVASDSLIALAYYSIPIALIYFVWKRTDLAFPTIFVLTGLFILACGTTHVMGVWTLWFPDYRLDGGIKAVTALLSVGTAIAIWKVMPLAGASEHGTVGAREQASWRGDRRPATSRGRAAASQRGTRAARCRAYRRPSRGGAAAASYRSNTPGKKSAGEACSRHRRSASR
jgi:hypothetical protein